MTTALSDVLEDTRRVFSGKRRGPFTPWNPEVNRRKFADWSTAMMTGDFGTAWEINDLQGQHWPAGHQLWSGEPLEHTSLELEARHGLGDFVQMMRFIPMLNQAGCTVSLRLSPELQPLASYFSGSFSTIGKGDSRSGSVTLELMELPYAVRLRPSQLPVLKNYLHLPPQLISLAQSRMTPARGVPRVGVVWSGSSWDPERWIPFDCLKPLFAMPCCEWWSMQGGPAATQNHHPALRKLQSVGYGSLLDLAAAIQSMDLVVTVDTLAAHIAGALGKEVWVLLKKNADWRWMQKRTDSPWYPSMRLFRQRDSGDWTTVVLAVQAALERRRSEASKTDRSSRFHPPGEPGF